MTEGVVTGVSLHHILFCFSLCVYISGSLLPVTVFDKHSLRVFFTFARDCPPSRPDVLVVIISMLSSAPIPVTNIRFQAAVPKVGSCCLPFIPMTAKGRHLIFWSSRKNVHLTFHVKSLHSVRWKRYLSTEIFCGCHLLIMVFVWMCLCCLGDESKAAASL